ncbi:MAG TPA: prolyl oligopeptidase family serine peptidase [Blastocatellia bacterium]|nr:prolyl oligopeptidase family serine peptidase [Blastocatellia bacterium]
MKKTLVAVGLTAMVAFIQVNAAAQQIPYLSELLSRSGAFYKLYNEKRRAGANLSAIEPLRKRGEEAFRQGNIPGVIELMGQGMSLLQGKQWDEKQRFLASLTVDTDRLVIEPNQELRVTLERIFPADEQKAFAQPLTVTFELVPGEYASQAPAGESAAQKLNGPIVIAERLAIAEASTNASRRLLIPDGEYRVVAKIEAGGQKIGEIKRAVYAIGDFSISLRQLSKTVADIKNSTDAKVKSIAALAATPEFQIQRLSALGKSRGQDEINVIQELDRIEATLAALSKGQNPFSSERGELERAYQASDGALVPYRVYVPASYDEKNARPLVLMLHGALGDEKYYFSPLFDPEVVKGEAERRGYILAGVNGRSRFPTYSGLSEEDSFEVIKAVTRDYKIDPSRIYLTGHSMGGFGTWLIAASKPGLFAAIAPMSSGVPAQGDGLTALLGKVKGVPALVVQGARDGIWPPERSRAAVEAAQKAGMKVSLLEIPDADHVGIIGASFAAVLDFFEKNSKPATAK